MLVVAKSSIRPYIYIIANTQSIPQLHPTFYGNIITNYNIILNKRVRADIAVLANSCASKHNGKLPYASIITDINGLYIRIFVDRIIHIYFNALLMSSTIASLA